MVLELTSTSLGCGIDRHWASCILEKAGGDLSADRHISLGWGDDAELVLVCISELCYWQAIRNSGSNSFIEPLPIRWLTCEPVERTASRYHRA